MELVCPVLHWDHTSSHSDYRLRSNVSLRSRPYGFSKVFAVTQPRPTTRGVGRKNSITSTFIFGKYRTFNSVEIYFRYRKLELVEGNPMNLT